LKESSDGETLIAVGVWFQIWGAAEEKARRPNSVKRHSTLRFLKYHTNELSDIAQAVRS